MDMDMDDMDMETDGDGERVVQALAVQAGNAGVRRTDRPICSC